MQRNFKLLLNQVATGDQDAFRQVFQQYGGKVYAFALKLTRSEATAEEIVQDVFMKIWIHRDALSSVDHFTSYLYAITRNHSFNVLKRLALERTAKAIFEQEQSDIQFYTEETVIYHEYQDLLRKAIDQLPPKQRLVYRLCHQQGLKYEEVAARLNISRLTVKTHMQQALRAIKLHFSSVISIAIPLFGLY